MRSKIQLAAAIAGMLLVTGPVAFAQDTRAIRDADKKRDEIYKRRSDEIMRMPETTEAQRNAKLRAINDLMAQWSAEKQQTSSMLGQIETANRQMESGTYYDPYTGRTYTSPANNRPSFMEKLLDKGLEIGGAVAGNLLNKWLNGGLSDNERKTLDDLLAERDSSTREGAGNPDNPLGKPIYDSNGNIIGWDRDGDNKSDFEDTDGDGNPDSWNGGTFKDGYDYEDPGVVASNDGASTPEGTGAMGSPGGAPSLGNSIGGGVSGDGGDSEDGADAAADEEDKDKENAEGEDGEDDEDGKGKGKKDKDKKNKKDGTSDDRELITVAGRVMVLPKPDPLAAPGLNANVAPGAKPGQKPGKNPAAKKDEWESDWGGDGWSDQKDNGDYDDDWGDEAWNDEWGKKPAQPGAQPGSQPGRPAPRASGPGGDPKLVDDLIRVEAVIASWRKVEKEKALREQDPYAFGNESELKGDYGQTGTNDPFAAYRTLDGRLDLSKVDVWVVIDDTWMDGKEPRRYRLRVTDDSADSFDPIHEGYMVLRGTILDLPVDANVLQEIKGEVKEMEVAQVVASSKERPAGNPLDPAAPIDPSSPNKNSDF